MGKLLGHTHHSDPFHRGQARRRGILNSCLSGHFISGGYVNLLGRFGQRPADLSTSGGYNFPTFATLYCEEIDGSEIGKTLTVIGRGTQRGSPLYLEGNLKGWVWGIGDGLQSWGQSIVDGFAPYNSQSENSLLGFVFASDGLHEAALSVGDSSGGVFVYTNNQWKLAGISYAVWPGLVSTTGKQSDPGVYASIFDDARGLYQKNAQGQWVLISYSEPLPGVNFASRISGRLEWIRSVAPDVVVSEPGTLVLLLCLGVSRLCSRLLVGMRRVKEVVAD